MFYFKVSIGIVTPEIGFEQVFQAIRPLKIKNVNCVLTYGYNT